jgi:hypothetical protein
MTMKLSPDIQQKIEQIATLQGISPEQFILQAVTEKLDALKQKIPNAPDTLLHPVLEQSPLREQDGILVFDTEPLDHINFNSLIEQSREQDWEQSDL